MLFLYDHHDNTNAVLNVSPGRVGAAQMQRRKLSGGPFLPVVLVLVLLRRTAPTHAHGGGGDRRASFARCVFILCFIACPIYSS